jgi:hypothetical protein
MSLHIVLLERCYPGLSAAGRLAAHKEIGPAVEKWMNSKARYFLTFVGASEPTAIEIDSYDELDDTLNELADSLIEGEIETNWLVRLQHRGRANRLFSEVFGDFQVSVDTQGSA